MNSSNFAEFGEEGLDVVLSSGGGKVRNSDGRNFVGETTAHFSRRNVFSAGGIFDTDARDVLDIFLTKYFLIKRVSKVKNDLLEFIIAKNRKVSKDTSSNES